MVRRVSRLTFDGSYSGEGRGHYAFILDDFVETGEIQCYSNVEAEYQALISGLHKAIQLDVDELVILGDSKTVLHQITGQIRSNKTRRLLDTTRRLLERIPTFTVEWVPRRENIAHSRIIR